MEDYKTVWKGRYDGEAPLTKRLFQAVTFEKEKASEFVLQGFAVDEGVRRNQGRVGAKKAPNEIRKALSNFPVVRSEFSLVDLGDIECPGGDLEASQKELAGSVAEVLTRGAKSIVLGGGHEVTWGHYQGIRKAFKTKSIGVINIDAHFDNRPLEKPHYGSSGTGFWQIAQEDELHSLHLGIQKNSNTLALFETAHKLGMNYILAEDLHYGGMQGVVEKIEEFASGVEVLYLTVCMDVFNASIAPGVSALAYNGIMADFPFLKILRSVLSYEHLVAMDVAEVNPEWDIQNRTSRLAASLVNEWLML